MSTTDTDTESEPFILAWDENAIPKSPCENISVSDETLLRLLSTCQLNKIQPTQAQTKTQTKVQTPTS